MSRAFVAFNIFIFCGCDPFVNEFSGSHDPSMFQANDILSGSSEYTGGPLKVLTWNIRFGAGRFPFFGDSCGEGVLSPDETVQNTIEAIADQLNSLDADIVFLQEVDLRSKRTAYLNQVQYLLDNTYLNYGAYASMWESDFIPTDGIGRINTGNAILSKYELTDAERIQLRLRTDQDDLIQYFYLRRNILKVRVPVLDVGPKQFFAVDIHATAFATDDTKEQHILKYIEVLKQIEDSNNVFVTGGDLNAVPPGSVIDFCESDMCSNETFHEEFSESFHKEGSFFENFPGEPDILVPLYDAYSPAIDSTFFNMPEHFTHAPVTSMVNDSTYTKYDRKLDYLFTNGAWLPGSGSTHQSAWRISDHMPVSAIFDPAGD